MLQLNNLCLVRKLKAFWKAIIGLAYMPTCKSSYAMSAKEKRTLNFPHMVSKR